MSEITRIRHSHRPARWSLPRGRIVRRVLREEPMQEYLTYVPSTGAVDAPVFVSVHGISRNAYEQACIFSPHCEKIGALLLVPRFTPERHRDYQRLGRRGRGVRADKLLERCIAEVASLTGANGTQIFLFGYSGGAQFAHRYFMAHPHRVARAVVAASGWYTFPDHRERYPYGIRANRRLPGVNFNPEEFLRVPVEVIVGQDDVGLVNLRSTERTIKQQGKNRIERARNWVTAMRAAADAHGVESRVSYSEVAGIDHSFSTFCREGDLLNRVFGSLFADSYDEFAATPDVTNDTRDPGDDAVVATLESASGYGQ